MSGEVDRSLLSILEIRILPFKSSLPSSRSIQRSIAGKHLANGGNYEIEIGLIRFFAAFVDRLSGSTAVSHKRNNFSNSKKSLATPENRSHRQSCSNFAEAFCPLASLIRFGIRWFCNIPID